MFQLNPESTFFFIRHGTTEANLQKLWCGGDWDIDLHEDGRRQAEKLSDRILDISSEFDHIYSSPMLRARQTMRLINLKAGKPSKVLEGLREWRIGVLEKQPWTDPLLGKPITSWPMPEGGESTEIFSERIASALRYCMQKSERPLIVSHGAVGRIVLDILKIPDQHIPNCRLFKFKSTIEGGKVLWTVTDYSVPVKS